MLNRVVCVLTVAVVATFAFASSHKFYDMLGVQKDATQRDIKRAFRKMALKLHPDKATDKEEAQRLFVELVEAYETLEDPAKRRSYDQNPSAFHPAPAPAGGGGGGGGSHGSGSSGKPQQQRYDEAQAKYQNFFSKLQRSFDDYIRRRQSENWKNTNAGDGDEDESFRFNFDELWEGADDGEVEEFNSLYRQHLEAHYTAHDRAVREVRPAGERLRECVG